MVVVVDVVVTAARPPLSVVVDRPSIFELGRGRPDPWSLGSNEVETSTGRGRLLGDDWDSIQGEKQSRSVVVVVIDVVVVVVVVVCYRWSDDVADAVALLMETYVANRLCPCPCPSIPTFNQHESWSAKLDPDPSGSSPSIFLHLSSMSFSLRSVPLRKTRVSWDSR